MNLETIIARQEKQIQEMFVVGNMKFQGLANDKLTPEALKDFHYASIKEILEGLLESEKDNLMNLELLNGAKMNGKFKRLDMKESIGWNKSKSDTINHLENIINQLK